MLVSGMIIGSVFTLFIVPVFYSVIATDHQAVAARASWFDRGRLVPSAR